MKCQICNGYIWTETDRALLKSWREHIIQYGFEIVCIAGHRRIVTPEDIKKYKEEGKCFKKE